MTTETLNPTPSQLAVLTCLQRVSRVLNTEAEQLEKAWGQNGTAERLRGLREQAERFSESLVRDIQAQGRVAQESATDRTLPKGIIMSQKP